MYYFATCCRKRNASRLRQSLSAFLALTDPFVILMLLPSYLATGAIRSLVPYKCMHQCLNVIKTDFLVHQLGCMHSRAVKTVVANTGIEMHQIKTAQATVVQNSAFKTVLFRTRNELPFEAELFPLFSGRYRAAIAFCSCN